MLGQNISSGGGGGPTYSGVEGHLSDATSQTTITSSSITTTTGRILIVFVFWDDGTPKTVSMTAGPTGVTWTSKISKTVDTRHNQAMQCFIGTGYTGGSSGVTATFSASTGDRAISVVEVTGANVTQFDATATSITGAGTAVTIAITTTQANCLVIGCTFNDAGTNTISAAPAGMTAINNFSGGQVVATHYRTVNPGTGATSINWTSSGTDQYTSMAVSVAP